MNEVKVSGVLPAEPRTFVVRGETLTVATLRLNPTSGATVPLLAREQRGYLHIFKEGSGVCVTGRLAPDPRDGRLVVLVIDVKDWRLSETRPRLSTTEQRELLDARAEDSRRGVKRGTRGRIV